MDELSEKSKQGFLWRVANFFSAVWHYLRWRPRLGEFHFRSRLGRCRMLTNPRSIRIGRRVLVRGGARLEAVGDCVDGRAKIVIGDGTTAQFDFHCGAAESVVIGKDVVIAGRVYITDHDHRFDLVGAPVADTDQLVTKPVVIGDGAWLGEGCAVLKGVTVGERAVVGANAVVTHDVPPWTVVAGSPAKIVRRIEHNEEEGSA